MPRTQSSTSRSAADEAPQLIFPCSGASDVGELADRAARALTRRGPAWMFCLAGIGGRVRNIVETTRSAASILAIDGCPLACARRCLEEAGFTDFQHLSLDEVGFKKGSSPVTRHRIDKVVEGAAALVGPADG